MSDEGSDSPNTEKDIEQDSNSESYSEEIRPEPIEYPYIVEESYDPNKHDTGNSSSDENWKMFSFFWFKLS